MDTIAVAKKIVGEMGSPKMRRLVREVKMGLSSPMNETKVAVKRFKSAAFRL